MAIHRQHDPRGDWRSILAGIDPSMAKLPATVHGAQTLASRGEPNAAIEAYREALQRCPYQPRIWRSLASLLARQGKYDEAIENRRIACRLEVEGLGLPEEKWDEAVEFLLAREGGTAEPTHAPHDYLSVVFDNYAESFEGHLVDKLRYRGPQVVYDAVVETLGDRPKDLCVLDAGCGTGLAGQLFRPLAQRLDGIDLSPGMIERAKAKHLYDQLVVGELAEVLTQSESAYDLVIAVDVFVYLGDLQPVFAACRSAIKADGVLAYTVEAGEAVTYQLRGTGRYVHAQEYLTKSMAAAELTTLRIDEAVLRYEGGQPVRSLVCLARKS